MPRAADVNFPRNFEAVVKKMFTRMFRVYAFLYYHMFEEFQKLGAEAYLNTCFKHFIFFVLEFNLVERSELEPLQELIDNMVQKSMSNGSCGGAAGAATATGASS